MIVCYGRSHDTIVKILDLANVHIHIGAPLLPRQNRRLVPFRHTDSPDPQVLPVLEGAILLRVGQHHRLAGQSQCIHELGHALRLVETAGQVRDGRDPDRYGHALCQQRGLVERVTGIVQGIVVVENQFGQVGPADVLVVALLVACRTSISATLQNPRDETYHPQQWEATPPPPVLHDLQPPAGDPPFPGDSS